MRPEALEGSQDALLLSGGDCCRNGQRRFRRLLEASECCLWEVCCDYGAM